MRILSDDPLPGGVPGRGQKLDAALKSPVAVVEEPQEPVGAFWNAQGGHKKGPQRFEGARQRWRAFLFLEPLGFLPVILAERGLYRGEKSTS